MGDEYGLPDLRQFMAPSTHFPAIPQPPEPFSVHRNLTPLQPHYEPIMLGRPTSDHHHHQALPCGFVEFHGDSTATATSATASGLCGLDMEGGNSRWPRQETLTLLEIRSRLDSKFKEVNQKGPLWDEISRIMAEEHGYQRSGKKCREKFENLYKYYKKTKEGKAGRQDGKHYRFFRQLEALYGDATTTINQASASEPPHLLRTSLLYHTTPNNNTTINNPPTQEPSHQEPKLCESLSFSNYSSEFETSSSDNNEDHDLSTAGGAFTVDPKKKRIVRRTWKAKIKEFVESHMKKLVETQDAWMEKMLKTIEHKEQERLSKEEEWRKLEAARIDREYKLWASERAWTEARDAALLEALKKLTEKEPKCSSPSRVFPGKETQFHERNVEDNASTDANEASDDVVEGGRWPEHEILSLIQVRASMEPRFRENGCLGDGIWEEVTAKMRCLGYDRSVVECKEKWVSINSYANKRSGRENLRVSVNYFEELNSCDNGNGHDQRPDHVVGLQLGHSAGDLSHFDSNMGSGVVQDSSFHNIMMHGGLHLWENNYGVKITKGKDRQG